MQLRSNISQYLPGEDRLSIIAFDAVSLLVIGLFALGLAIEQLRRLVREGATCRADTLSCCSVPARRRAEIGDLRLEHPADEHVRGLKVVVQNRLRRVHV